MLYIIATIFISVFLLFLFKLFTRYQVNSFAAIIINYIVAFTTGMLFFDEPIEINKIVSSAWFPIAVPLGGVFLFIFYLISQTTQRISIATASVANKMSVVIPVLFSIFYLHEELPLLKLCGVCLALLAVYLASASSSNEPYLKKLAWLPILVFFGSGFIDVTLNYTNAFKIKSSNDSAAFTTVTFLSAFCFGIIVVLYQLVTQKASVKTFFNVKNIIAGIALGVPNYFSIYFIFKSLDTHILNSAQLFPVLNLCNVALAAITGWLIFKEKLSVKNIAGIILALIAIILIAI
ncbi:MAG: EamA family transporter [Bacteroidetes bacterium]|nr:EamA family transporter [Bacteroidota bacterium]